MYLKVGVYLLGGCHKYSLNANWMLSAHVLSKVYLCTDVLGGWEHLLSKSPAGVGCGVYCLIPVCQGNDLRKADVTASEDLCLQQPQLMPNIQVSSLPFCKRGGLSHSQERL